MSEVQVEVEGRLLRLSNLDKVLYPRTGTTKGEVLNYYAQIAPVLLPHLADRAVTRIRWPNGVEGQSFYEKNVPNGVPSWVRTIEVPTTGSRGGKEGEIRFPVIDSVAALTYFANLASLELHVHQWTVSPDGELRNPNRLVIDLDPGEPAGLGECAQVALLVRDRLRADGLECVPVTSGSKGIHLYAELDGSRTSAEASEYAHTIADQLQEEHRHLVVSEMTKAKRGGKVFLDWSQNVASKTTLSPYSLRGRERPNAAAPRTWEEIEAGAEDPLDLEQVRYDELLERVADHGDLFALDRTEPRPG